MFCTKDRKTRKIQTNVSKDGINVVRSFAVINRYSFLMINQPNRASIVLCR